MARGCTCPSLAGRREPAMQTQEPWPYSLPIFARAHRAISPNGRMVAEIIRADEVSMSNPTSGRLHLSVGLQLEDCNPNLLWSDDSRYLAVPRFFFRLGLLRRQRVVVIDTVERRVHASTTNAHYFQLESFALGALTVIREPLGGRLRESWMIPRDLGRFARQAVSWAATPTAG